MKSRVSRNVQKSMVSSVVKTFSDMAFIDAVETPGAPEELTFSHIIHITFSEPEEGEIALFFPLECKRLIVENIYGIDWNTLDATAIDDCLLEMLNVMAGNFLNQYFGEDVKHSFSLPQLLFDEAEIRNRNRFVDYFFDAEGIPFKVSICLKKGHQPAVKL